MQPAKEKALMQPAIEQMLKKYHCHSQQDYMNALKEIFQEIALLGLWRAKFYEKAAFYGSSALRILHGLDRFSEDLDFTLLSKDPHFNLSYYNKFIVEELKSFGFLVHIVDKEKNFQSNIKSAFLKAESKKQLIEINAPHEFIKNLHSTNLIKIKMEVDINPPLLFETEVKTLLQPIPFSIKSMALSSLFASKIHALLYRPWVTRTKGQDWYDFVWYIAREVPVNLVHLQQRLKQNFNTKEQNLKSDAAKRFSAAHIIKLLEEKINQTNFKEAKQDVLPFLKDSKSIAIWSPDFFNELIKKIKFE